MSIELHYVTTSFPLAEIYAFSAKERDMETGLSYFGARYYSSDLSIWLSVDPMSDKYPSLSPYVYCAENPVRCVDPNGEEFSEHIDKYGNLIAHYDDGDNSVYLHDEGPLKFKGAGTAEVLKLGMQNKSTFQKHLVELLWGKSCKYGDQPQDYWYNILGMEHAKQR